MEDKKNTPTEARWALSDGQVVLLLPDGQKIQTASAAITGAEFKGRFTIDEYQVAACPSDAIPDLSFHRFPLQLRLELCPPSAHKKASCTFTAFDEDHEYELPAIPDSDQLLKDAEWFPISSGDSYALKEALNAAGINHPGEISLKQYYDIIRERHFPVSISKVPEAADPQDATDSIEALPAIGFHGELYPFQARGVDWLLNKILAEDLGGILGDEMGLGKTVQVIFVLTKETVDGRTPNLVVAPSTLLENWRREIKKFSPGLKVALHQGGDRDFFPSDLKKNDVVLMSYDIVWRDDAMLNTIDWNLVICDEAQAIKNPDTKRSKAVKGIQRRAGIAMTGTPVENSLADLWSIMEFTSPGLLGTREEFEGLYEDDPDDASLLEKRISPLLLRRKINDVFPEMPERNYVRQAVNLSPAGASEYEQIRKDVVAEHGKGAGLAALTKLRMFCTHPFLVNDGKGDPSVHSSKYARLLELMDEIVLKSNKAIIFTSYTKMIDILVSDLSSRYGLHCDFIDGRVPSEERLQKVDHFSEAPAPAVLMLNPKAAGVGLNITAANHVIHYNLEWNPATEDQATGRAYRHGQKRPVTIHRLFHPETVEEVIDDRVNDKRDLAAAAIKGNKGEGSKPEDLMRALGLSPQNVA